MAVATVDGMPKRLRVLLDVSAVPDNPVGAGVFTVALATGLTRDRSDIDLVLLARGNDADRWARLTPEAEVHAVVPGRRPMRLAWEQWSGPRLARKLKIDVWHGPHYTLPLRLSTPSVVTVHDLTFFTNPKWHEKNKVRYFRRMIRAAVKRAAVTVCVSDATAQQLAVYAPPSGPVRVIHHGVNHDRFAVAPEMAALDDARLSVLGVRQPFIAFVGTLEPRKGLVDLVDAFAEVASKYPDLQLVLAGSPGWGTAELDAAITACPSRDKILRTGYLPNDSVPSLLRRAAVVAYPSLDEGFGLPALEALACGAPLVASAVPAIGEVVGEAAVLVSPGDKAALVAGLNQALAPAESERLRIAGPKRAAEFTWGAAVDSYAEVYEYARTK